MMGHAERALAAEGLMMISMKESTDYTIGKQGQAGAGIILLLLTAAAICGLLSAGAGSAGCECEFASARHCVNSACDLWIGVVENL